MVISADAPDASDAPGFPGVLGGPDTSDVPGGATDAPDVPDVTALPTRASRYKHGSASQSFLGSVNWVGVVVIFVCVCFIGGYVILSTVLIAQQSHAADATAAMNSYARKVAALSKSQTATIRKALDAYDKNLRATSVADPFQPKGLAAPSAQYNQILKATGDDQVMVWLSVPSIDLVQPIYYGHGESYPREQIEHIASTAIPDDMKGIHSVLVGHAGLDTSILFTNLNKVKKGETFQVRILDMELTYTVDNITIVKPTQMDALKAVAGHSYVTLLTCTPIGINDHRLLVRGDLTSVTQVAGSSSVFTTAFNPWLFFVPGLPLSASTAGLVFVLKSRRAAAKKVEALR